MINLSTSSLVCILVWNHLLRKAERELVQQITPGAQKQSWAKKLLPIDSNMIPSPNLLPPWIALLINAAPTSDTQLENLSLGRIQKRGFVALYTPLINGEATTPGTQYQPGVWIRSDTIHICSLSCLDPDKPSKAKATCLEDKCLSTDCAATSCVNVRSPLIFHF